MKECFTPKRFGTAAREMIDTIDEILESYRAQGYDLSVRQLYYQLVSRNLVTNTEKSYKQIGKLVSEARLAGDIDWDMIKDRGREMVCNPHWLNPADFLEKVAPQFRFDLWHDQDVYVEVMVEKQALEGVLEPVCRSFDICFTANKGYSSSSALYEAAKRFLDNSRRECYILYLGDHDPSGIDMSRDVEDRLNLFLQTWEEGQVGGELMVQVKRIALNMDQIRRLNPPENPAKITDSRAASYIQKFGQSSWELDAIEPAELANLVRNAVLGLMDQDRWRQNELKQTQDRKKLSDAAKKFKK